VVSLISPTNGTLWNFSTTPNHLYNVTDAADNANCTFAWGGTFNGTQPFIADTANGSIFDAGYLLGVPNGNITWNITCSDASGATGVSETDWYLVNDTTPPVISSPSPSGTLSSSTTSVTLSVTTDESATCSYDTNDIAYASMANSFADNMTVHTRTYNVSAGNSYTFYVRCSDVSENNDTSSTPISFSVATTSSGGSSGGGGGGGGGGGSSMPYLSTVPMPVLLSLYGYFQFTMTASDTLIHTVRIKSLTPTGATLHFESTPVDMAFNIGETKQVDLNGDGTGDVSVKLLNVTSTTASFTIATTAAASTPTPTVKPTPKVTTNGAIAVKAPANGTQILGNATTPSGAPNVTNATGIPPPVEETAGVPTWIWVLVLLVIVIVFGIWLALQTGWITVEK
jgi:hypothetical protein